MQDVCIYRSLLRAWGCMFIVLCLTASFFQRRPLRPHPTSLSESQPIHPTQRGHNRLWRYTDWCGVYDLSLSVIWLSVLITVKPSVPVWEFNVIACLIELKNPPLDCLCHFFALVLALWSCGCGDQLTDSNSHWHLVSWGSPRPLDRLISGDY